MQDPRLKVLSTVALSIGAYLSLIGALLAIVWWIVNGKFTKMWNHPRLLGSYALFIIFVAMLIQFNGGDGISYAIRLTAIILVASWAYGQYQSGEMLNLFVWGFGKRSGFEIGLIAEMSMQTLSSIGEDIDRIKNAITLKGMRWGWKTIGSAVPILLHMLLQRSEEQAKILAVRGYHHGGTLCPSFQYTKFDILATVCAIFIACSALIPPGEFFILPH